MTVTRRVCIRCGTLQPANGGQPCTACGASSFSLIPEKAPNYHPVTRSVSWPGAGEDERDYSPETP